MPVESGVGRGGHATVVEAALVVEPVSLGKPEVSAVRVGGPVTAELLVAKPVVSVGEASKGSTVGR